MVRTVKNNYYLALFSNVKDSATVWSKLLRVGLITSKNLVERLFNSTEELNRYFMQITSDVSDKERLMDVNISQDVFD